MKNSKQKEVGEVTEKGVIDVIGKCGNCGVEFHIHKDIMDEVEKNQELQKFDEETKLQVIQTKEDADIFYKEMENPSEPNEKLKKAFKKKEILEEAAQKYANKIWDYSNPDEKILHANCNKAFLKGAKWQAERSVSIEAYEDSLNMQRCSNAGFESKISELQEQIKRMYTEEEVGELLYTVIGQCARHHNIIIDGRILNDLFKEFKKK